MPFKNLDAPPVLTVLPVLSPPLADIPIIKALSHVDLLDANPLPENGEPSIALSTADSILDLPLFDKYASLFLFGA